jgi:hypothetical protein
MVSTLSVASECHRDHGWAAYCTKDSRRCLLLETTHGLTDDDVHGLPSNHGSISHSFRNHRRKRSNPTSRLPKTVRFRGRGRFKKDRINGKSTEAVEVQDQVPQLSSDNVLIGSIMAWPRVGCKRDRRVRLHAIPGDIYLFIHIVGTFEDYRKFRRGRRTGYSFRDTTRSCPDCFEGSSSGDDVITWSRQTITVCSESRIRRGPAGRWPRASVGFGVASHPSGA